MSLNVCVKKSTYGKVFFQHIYLPADSYLPKSLLSTYLVFPMCMPKWVIYFKNYIWQHLPKTNKTIVFRNIFLGETFSSYICVHNDSSQVAKDIVIKVSVLIIFNRIILAYYCKCCPLIGYSTRYLFLHTRERVAKQ